MKSRDPKNFNVLGAVLLAVVVVLAWAAIQAWLLDAPLYGLATASGALIAGIVSFFVFRWLKEERSETRDG